MLAGVGVTQFGAAILPIQALGADLSCRLAAHHARRRLELVARQQNDGMAGGGFAQPLRHHLDQQMARRAEVVFVGDLQAGNEDCLLYTSPSPRD